MPSARTDAPCPPGRATGAPAALMVRAGCAALRGNPLRTAPSALGVVIGVGAMVAVLALSDGVEHAVRERMAADGRLLSVRVAPRTVDVVDGQLFLRATWATFTIPDARALAARLGDTAAVQLAAGASGLVAAIDSPPPRAEAPRGVSSV